MSDNEREFVKGKAWNPKESMGIMNSNIKIPLEIFIPHEKQALKNHDQTIEVLSQRGGINSSEALAILGDKEFKSIDNNIAVHELKNLIITHLETRLKQSQAKVDKVRKRIEEKIFIHCGHCSAIVKDKPCRKACGTVSIVNELRDLKQIIGEKQ